MEVRGRKRLPEYDLSYFWYRTWFWSYPQWTVIPGKYRYGWGSRTHTYGNEGPKGYGKAGSLEGFCSGGGISRLAGYFGTEGSAKELAERAEAGDERALAVYARCGAVLEEVWLSL